MNQKAFKTIALAVILSAAYALGGIVQYKAACKDLRDCEKRAGVDAAFERAELMACENNSLYSRFFGYGSRLAAKNYLDNAR